MMKKLKENYRRSKGREFRNIALQWKSSDTTINLMPAVDNYKACKRSLPRKLKREIDIEGNE